VTTYRLFPSTNGPSAPVSYSGNFLAGVMFKVTQGGMWLNGYYHWVPGTNGDTVARKFALWTMTAANTGALLPAANVTSGTLTAGQWNFVALPSPVPLAPSTAYIAATGWSAVHGFPDSDTSGAGTGAADSFGAGGHTAGITQGPLFAYSDNGQSAPPPYSMNQGLFSTAGTDPTVNMPNAGSNSGNFWMDVQVSDTPPAGYSGSYRLYPNKVDANPATTNDASVNYVLATEFHLSQACTLNKIWYYSPSGTAQLATSCRIWSIQGANAGTSVVTQTSPSWSGAAGSGWVSCSFTGATLPAGSYKVSVYNGAATPDGWGAKDASTNYWGAGGDGVNGFTTGPLSVPGLSAASTAYKFVSSGAGNTPPYTDGSTTEAGQSTFANGTGDVYPYLYVDALAQNYWLDVEVTPVTSSASAEIPLIPPGMMSPPGLAFAPLRLARALVPDPSPPAAVAHPGAAVLSGTGSLTAAGTVSFTSAAVLSGSGALTSAGQKTVPGAAALSGSGTLAASPLTAFAASCSLSGSGTLTVAALVTQPAAAALAGSGSLAAAAAVRFAVSAVLSGSGALAAAAVVTQPAAAALSGSGSLAAAPSVLFASAAALSGSGALTAAGTVSGLAQGSAALSGTGTLTAAASLVLRQAVALAGSGTITIAGLVTVPGGAALSGTGLLLTAVSVTMPAAAALSGSGSLSAAPAVVFAAAAALAGFGVIAVTARVVTPVAEPPVLWSVQPAALRWRAAPLPPRWTASPSAPRWRIVMALFPPIAAVSLECVNVLWLSDLDGTTVDPTGATTGQPQLPVQFAFPQTSGNYAEPAQPVTWLTGSWLLGGTGRGYIAQALVGPGGGVVTLTAGLTFDVWARVTGIPESPAKFAGTLAVY